MKAPISLSTGMPARATPTAPLSSEAASQTQMKSQGAGAAASVQQAGAEIEGRQRHQPEDHDRQDVLHVQASDQSTFAPDAFTTSAHFGISDLR